MGLGAEITEVVPLALVIALSPLSIIPGILMPHTQTTADQHGLPDRLDGPGSPP